MILKDRKKRVWCNQTTTSYTYVKKLTAPNGMKCKLVGKPSSIRCKDCGKAFKPCIRMNDDGEFLYGVPPHKKTVKIKKV